MSLRLRKIQALSLSLARSLSSTMTSGWIVCERLIIDTPVDQGPGADDLVASPIRHRTDLIFSTPTCSQSSSLICGNSGSTGIGGTLFGLQLTSRSAGNTTKILLCLTITFDCRHRVANLSVNVQVR
ncbi:MAG: hypothetical protein IPF93_22005 [Saprospiraceae bacterium]|nr:hypothetical protein [Saprospiraceae bacterium]